LDIAGRALHVLGSTYPSGSRPPPQHYTAHNQRPPVTNAYSASSSSQCRLHSQTPRLGLCLTKRLALARPTVPACTCRSKRPSDTPNRLADLWFPQRHNLWSVPGPCQGCQSVGAGVLQAVGQGIQLVRRGTGAPRCQGRPCGPATTRRLPGNRPHPPSRRMAAVTATSPGAQAPSDFRNE
jgi:hypothetical protein